MKDALGLVEIRGMSTAILVADLMVKTANVRIIEVENAKGLGYMTIKVAGDVGAVTAAVEAGKEAGIVEEKLVSSIVIARPADGMATLFCKEEQSQLIIHIPETKEKTKEQAKRTTKEKAVRKGKSTDKTKKSDKVKKSTIHGPMSLQPKPEVIQSEVIPSEVMQSQEQLSKQSQEQSQQIQESKHIVPKPQKDDE